MRAAVGDRYVLELLRRHGGVLGGETSGHLLCLDRTTTGDGLVSALQVLAVMKRTGRTLAELAAGMPQFPQVMVNVRVAGAHRPRQSPAIQDAVRRVEAALGTHGPGGAARLRHRTADPRHGRGRGRGGGVPARERAGGDRPPGGVTSAGNCICRRPAAKIARLSRTASPAGHAREHG